LSKFEVCILFVFNHAYDAYMTTYMSTKSMNKLTFTYE